MKDNKWTYKTWKAPAGDMANAFLYDTCRHSCLYCIEILSKMGDKREEGSMFTYSLNYKGLSSAFDRMRRKGFGLAFGTVSDVYQKGNVNEKIRRFLETMKEIKERGGWIPETSILTKSNDVLMDKELLKELGVKVKFSTTSHDELAKYLEPGAPHTSERVRAAQSLLEEEIYAEIFLNPVLPLDMNCQEDNIARIASYVSGRGVPVRVGRVLKIEGAEFANRRAPDEIIEVTENMVSVLSNDFNPEKYIEGFKEIIRSHDSLSIMER